jgi:hypothetical protein
MLHDLHKAAFTYPAIDNHAHNILKAEKDPHYPLEGLAGEGRGEAARDVRYTAPFYRASKQLAGLYGVELDPNDSEESRWERVLKARGKLTYEGICRRNFGPSGIQCILLDDLMVGIENNCMETREHDRFTSSPTRRIVRLETVAEVSVHYHLNI